jgi:ectoine hydroxylase-related dioxygenase (phytanoyl-CoA dioxygenase family)
MSGTCSLNVSEVARFKETGYLVIDDFLHPGEVAEYQQAYIDCLEEMRLYGKFKPLFKGEAEDGTQTAVYQIRAAHLKDPAFNRLIRELRILDRVESLIGPDLQVVLCQGLYKPPRTGGEIFWHQDDYYFRVSKPNAVVSCWIALDDATVDYGCMWVIPGGHGKIEEHVRVGTQGSGYTGVRMAQVDEAAGVAVQLKAGQCMLHHGSLPHRTLTNTTDTYRRALSIHYMDATARPLGEGRQQEPPENMPVVRGTAPGFNGAS